MVTDSLSEKNRMQFDKLGATIKIYLTGFTGFDGSTASGCS
jgi:hypothetical protein